MNAPTRPPTQKATLIKLENIRKKIAVCRKQEGREPWLITATLRHTAETVAARFVDPKWIAEEEEPTS
jgi:hypothetical protein